MTERRFGYDKVIRVEDEFYILATSDRVDDRTRVLKQGESFAVFDRRGDLHSIGLGEFGLFHEGTRYLSQLELHLGGGRPMLLSSTITEDNALLAVDLTNPDMSENGAMRVDRGLVHIFRAVFLWDGRFYERLRVTNYGSSPVELSLRFLYDADYADIFEVRGTSRETRGHMLPESIDGSTAILGYQGLDGVVRRTRLEATPAPESIGNGEMTFSLRLVPHTTEVIYLTVSCEGESTTSEALSFDDAYHRAGRLAAFKREQGATIYTANEEFQDLLNRADADLHMMFTETKDGVYPYAGVPWYSAPFGRDGIITALQYLWVNPRIARGVLAFLARTQADEEDPERDAEPGKILHEARRGEMAALGEIPFRQYYGSVDSTPLFIILAAAYFRRTADREFLETLWPHIERALEWIDRYGDRDRDGFVEYFRRSDEGLLNQGWKDSFDAVFHADGRMAEGPIAICEVQGYVYAARRAAAGLAAIRGDARRASLLRRKADRLRLRLEEAFWCEDLGTYALALDGNKQPCAVRTSNPGHLLFCGIADPVRARRTAELLTSEAMYSGWGIRTVSMLEARYNPMSYHNGSVWPHDNAIVGYGFSRYGFRQQAARVLGGLLEASALLDLRRLPELFCGLVRRPGVGPTLYPVACSPQSWASGAPFLLLQGLLGLDVKAATREVRLTRPWLPQFLDRVGIRNLHVADAIVDLELTRDREDVVVTVVRREGEVNIVTVK